MPKPFTVVTWNINSVRLRLAHVEQFVREVQPDVLCLQEIKCRDGEFPLRAFSDMGLKNLHVVGQKGWHGVAVASKHRIEKLGAPALCPHAEARVAAVRIKGVEIHNLYVPAGGDVADTESNPKFAHKMDVLARMEAYYGSRAGRPEPLLVVGDLNIAPGEHDVWSHKQLLTEVSHTPIETDALERIRTTASLVDVTRALRPPPEKIFTWWSYRSPDWAGANKGRRLDHIWATPDLAEKARSVEVHQRTRGWERPSDHAPLAIGFAL